MSLRSSTGRSNAASVSVSCTLKTKRASPIGDPFASSARTMPVSGAPVFARSTFTTMRAAAFSAAVSACGGAMPLS